MTLQSAKRMCFFSSTNTPLTFTSVSCVEQKKNETCKSDAYQYQVSVSIRFININTTPTDTRHTEFLRALGIPFNQKCAETPAQTHTAHNTHCHAPQHTTPHAVNQQTINHFQLRISHTHAGAGARASILLQVCTAADAILLLIIIVVAVTTGRRTYTMRPRVRSNHNTVMPCPRRKRVRRCDTISYIICV